MKRYIISITVLNLFVLLNSCKKEITPVYSVSSLNVINAAPDIASLDVFFSTQLPEFYLYQNSIYYGSSYEFGQVPGDIPVVIFSSSDTLNPLYNGKVTLKERGIYSLYLLSGSSKGDVLLTEDSIPVRQDSTAGLRFINLSGDSHPLTINLEGNDPNQTEFGPLAYKQNSSFKSYDARLIGGSYNFEIRDPSISDPIATFSWNYTMGKNYTIVVSGLESEAVTAFQVNNF